MDSVILRGWHDLMLFVRFLVLSVGGGIVVGYINNKEELLGLRKEDTGVIRFVECQGYLDRD